MQMYNAQYMLAEVLRSSSSHPDMCPRSIAIVPFSRFIGHSNGAIIVLHAATVLAIRAKAMANGARAR
jgi:hypothetical protein